MAKKKITKGSKFAIATASCKRSGYTNFEKGSAGDKCRKKRAEGIAREKKVVPGPAKKRRS